MSKKKTTIIHSRRLVLMKNNRYVLLILLPILLGSCSKTKELYDKDAYNSTDFIENYYTEKNNVDKVSVIKEELIEASNENVYLSSFSSFESGKHLNGLKGNDQYDENYNLLEWGKDTPKVDLDGYGPAKCLTRIDNAFADGFLSRLYDGRVRCDGLYQHSRVQLSESGYATFFSKELISAKYFAMSMFNKTSPNTNSAFGGCLANMDLEISFYQHTSNNNEYNKFIVDIKNYDIPIDAGGEASLMLFYFSDIFGNDYLKYLNGVTAMSFSYKINKIKPGANVASEAFDNVIEKYGIPTSDNNVEATTHMALMLYEVLIPDSSWR